MTVSPGDNLVVVPAKLLHVAAGKDVANDVDLVSVSLCLQQLLHQPLQLTCRVRAVDQ